MAWKAIAVLVCMVLSGCQAQNFYSCGFLTTLNCDDFPVEEICATNGQTYKNRCMFGKAHCQDLDIHLKHDKPCNPSDFTTTPHPTATVGTTVASGGEVVLDIFCAYLRYKPCPPSGVVVEYLCGTDGRTYENFCEYEKERCTHRDLHIHSWGNCTN